MTRTHQINIKLSVQENNLLKKISDSLGIGLATFMRRSAIKEANDEKIILQQIKPLEAISN